MPWDPSKFWSLPLKDLEKQLDTTQEGLSDSEARSRQKQYSSSLLRERKEKSSILLFLAQFKSPIILLLVFAASLSIFLRQSASAIIILIIIFISGSLGFWQERRAADAMTKLLDMVRIKATILRNGREQDIPIENIVPGDVVLLRAGNIIPGDCRITR
jgi:P-type Mg2+ transporter